MVWMIYLLGVVDEISFVLSVCWIVALIACIAFIIIYPFGLSECYDDARKACFQTRWGGKLKHCIIWTILCGLLISLIPTSKTIAAMYLVPKIAANEQIQKLPNKVLDIMNLKLDQWMNELTKEKAKKDK